jgi:hypothetical protein
MRDYLFFLGIDGIIRSGLCILGSLVCAVLGQSLDWVLSFAGAAIIMGVIGALALTLDGRR